MDLFETIKKRHSYRGCFKDISVPREDLEKIVRAGLDAPSGKNAQTTQFVIVDEAGIVSEIARMHTGNKAMQQAKAFIACIVDKNPDAVYEDFSFQVEDCAAAVENMFLAITALGYASVWIDGWLRIENHAAIIGGMLNVPDTKCIRVLLPVGIPAEQYKPPEKKKFTQRVWFNRYSRA